MRSTCIRFHCLGANCERRTADVSPSHRSQNVIFLSLSRCINSIRLLCCSAIHLSFASSSHFVCTQMFSSRQYLSRLRLKIYSILIFFSTFIFASIIPMGANRSAIRVLNNSRKMISMLEDRRSICKKKQISSLFAHQQIHFLLRIAVK